MIRSDFFYVWLKRTVSHFYPEHFASVDTPKSQEAVVDPIRHGGSKERAKQAYEAMMHQAFVEARRVLKPSGQMVVVYAHKTTQGWVTMIDALRRAGFVVTEAWPLDTEMKSRMSARNVAALASSVFLVCRKRATIAGVGNYEEDVKPDLVRIVRERIETLWDIGISGADLVISCVGAGLRAFTQYERVEYANGEEVSAETFLAEVEKVILETMLAKLLKKTHNNDSQQDFVDIDPITRFYVLWRYTYRHAGIDIDKVNALANEAQIELNVLRGLFSGTGVLIEKKGDKYRLRDFADRGQNENLGAPNSNGQTAPLIDILHRTLWLMNRGSRSLGEFLLKAQPNRDQMRLVAQVLVSPILKGSRLAAISSAKEQAALAKLTSNWRNILS